MKIAHAVALCLIVLPIAQAMAAPQTITLKFQTVLTANEFLIKAKTKLPSATEITSFAYDNVRHAFTSYTNEFGITSTKSVTAKLQAVAELVDGKNKIPLTVTLGGKALAVTPTAVHTGDPAEKPYAFVVAPVDKIYPAGTYKGDVVLIFDVT